ncbi:hypothetical protein CHU98_g10596 [Xylaria longipes]|nr:hypothetical protein CHU98_g10596 [Xylaria longipes]
MQAAKRAKKRAKKSKTNAKVGAVRDSAQEHPESQEFSSVTKAWAKSGQRGRESEQMSGATIETIGNCQDTPSARQELIFFLAFLGRLVPEEKEGLGPWPGRPLRGKYPTEPGTRPPWPPPQRPITREVLLHPDGDRPIAKSFRLPIAKV